MARTVKSPIRKHTPTDDLRKLARSMAEDGESMLEIARTLGVAPGTLRKHYETELREGGDVYRAHQAEAQTFEMETTREVAGNPFMEVDIETLAAIAAVMARAPSPPSGKRPADFSCQTPGCKVRVSRVTDPGVVFVKARGMWFCSDA